MRRLCRSAESESFKDSKEKKAQEGQRFIRAGEAQVRGARRGKKTKVEAFGKLKFSQVWEEMQEAQEEHTAVRSAGEEIWTVEIHVQEELRRSAQEEETDSRRISLKKSRQPLDREELRLASGGGAHKENRSEPLDLGQISRQPSDLSEGTCHAIIHPEKELIANRGLERTVTLDSGTAKPRTPIESRG
jgi:hypothetical protein